MGLKIDNHWQPNSASRYLASLDQYKDAVVCLFPALPRRAVDSWAILPIDALILGHFLESYRRRVVALDIGTFIGASAFCLASHPKVTKVITVDPNPTIFDEFADKTNVHLSARFGENIDLDQLRNLRVLDVARATLAKFSNEREKIQFREGVVGSAQVNLQGEPSEGLKKVDITFGEPSENAGLIAFVDGLHTREGVQADLTAIFDQNPHAVAVLDDCRYRWGPVVQAGVVDFMEQATGEYHFDLIGDLGPGLATSSLGIVYSGSAASETRRALNEVNRMFSRRLDLLRLLSREEELVATINERIQQLQETKQKRQQTNQQLQETREKLQQVNENLRESRESETRLESRVSSRRYRLADAAAERALRIPGLRSLLR
jgi:hypothetical protein